MITTTLADIRKLSPCQDSWKVLLKGLGVSRANKEPLPLERIYTGCSSQRGQRWNSSRARRVGRYARSKDTVMRSRVLKLPRLCEIGWAKPLSQGTRHDNAI